MKNYKSGFVAIIGRSNVGKSTLMNQMIGEKVAIVSNKPQTTRNQIKGIHTSENCQVVFLDTPGLHLPKNKLGKFMVKAAMDALEGVDAVLAVVDASEYIGAGDMAAINALEKIDVPVILVLNKIDIIEKRELLSIIERFRDTPWIKEIIPVSARKGEGVDDLLESLHRYIPEGPQYFPDDMITDRPEMFIVRELIREKALHNLSEEIPHGIGVEILRIEKKSNTLIEIHVNLVCEKASHKPIIIGKRGAMIKTIGTSARKDIERLFGNKVNLQLWVRVKELWRDNTSLMRDYGYDE